jgi:hypothetical protein
MSREYAMEGAGRGRRVTGAIAAAAAAALLAACGTVTPSTPAHVTPASNPLPGFSRAIQDAQNAAAQESYDNGMGSTNVTVPTVTTP